MTNDPMTIVGDGPFYDCNLGATGLRAPDPTNLPHGFGDWPNTGLNDGVITCFLDFTPQSFWDDTWPISLPDIPIVDDDRIIHNSADGNSWTGDVVFYGSRIKWINEPGVGSITGQYTCAPGAIDIEVDGECICGEAVPEAGNMVGVTLSMTCLFAVALVQRRRKRRRE